MLLFTHGQRLVRPIQIHSSRQFSGNHRLCCLFYIQSFQNVFAREVNSQLANRHQHDSQEFLSLLVDSLHEEMNRVLKFSLENLSLCKFRSKSKNRLNRTTTARTLAHTLLTTKKTCIYLLHRPSMTFLGFVQLKTGSTYY